MRTLTRRTSLKALSEAAAHAASGIGPAAAKTTPDVKSALIVVDVQKPRRAARLAWAAQWSAAGRLPHSHR